MAVGEKRKPGRPKGTPASEAQKATNAGARKAAAEAKRKRREERERQRAAELELESKPRWKKLEDGDISLKDLDMDELLEGSTRNNDGSWEGRRHRFNTRWLQRMDTERRRRIRAGIDKLAEPALDALEEILDDADAPAQRFAAAKMITEYQIGKVPDVVHVGVENEWDRLQQSAFRIERGVGAVTVEQVESAGDSGEPVDGELVEEES